MTVEHRDSEPPYDRFDDDHLTDWTLVLVAKQSPAVHPAAKAAQERLLNQYKPAIVSYLLAGVRDPDAVQDLFQMLALRLAEGRLANADPSQGRFRHYLKMILRNIISDHHKSLGRRPRPLDAVTVEPAEADDSFVLPDDELLNESYRQAVLQKSWDDLRRHEALTGQPYWTLLSFVAKNPDMRPIYPEIVSRFGALIHSQNKEAAARKLVHRARSEFATLLLESLSQTLAEPTLPALEEELIELRLLKYVQKELRRRRLLATGTNGSGSS